MKHINDDDLVLLYYGDRNQNELQELQTHLAGCGECRTEFERVTSLLAAIDFPTPEPPEHYGRDVWYRLHPILPNQARTPRFGWFGAAKWATAVATAAILFAAFNLGRWFEQSVENTRTHPSPQTTSVDHVAARERALLLALGAHLERAQVVLTELANTNLSRNIDISSEQEVARTLIPDNRLYREAAMQLADRQIANMLDELERLLLDVSHRPSEPSTSELHDIREQIESQGILFKVRVAGAELRRRQRNTGL
jgi:hypothetical protein